MLVKKLLTISLLFLAQYSFASHLLGGEITYEHLTNKKYQINVKLYRDCDDCKLGGQGGGSSTSNCSDLTELFIATYGSCGNSNVGSIALQKVGFHDITSVCSQEVSKCQPNANYNYGFEAHSYRGIIDFEDFSAFKNCAFQLFIHKSERSNSITTLNNENEDLFTYAIINPWITNHSSPSFNQATKFLFNLNQPVYFNDGALANKGDSLRFKWGAPLGSKNKNIPYKLGYSPNHFITPYCPNGDCTPNPNASIPTGISLNPLTGDVTFTPTSANETSTRVLEVEQWRKLQGSWQQLGVIRRDIIVKVVNANYNNPPTLSQSEITICEGEVLNAEISISDIPAVINGNTQASDTVRISAAHNLSGLLIEEVATTSAPYYKLRLSLENTLGKSGSYPIHITAIDNHCPKPATTNRTVLLTILPKPVLDIDLSHGFCGTTTLELRDTIGLKQANASFRNALGERQTYNLLSGQVHYQSIKEEKIDVELRIEDQFGCINTDTTSYINTGRSIPKAELVGDTLVCENENLAIHLQHALDISNITWTVNSEEIVEDTLQTTPANTIAGVSYTLVFNDFRCPFTDTFTIAIKIAPLVQINEPSPLCLTEDIDLKKLQPSPAGGNWIAPVPIINDVISKSFFANENQILNLTYSFTNENNCTDSKHIQLPLKQAPELELIDEVLCGDKFAYKLSNTIRKPYDKSNKNIAWTLLTKIGAKNGEGLDAHLDLPAYGTGEYIVVGKHELSNGCIAEDTVNISVEDALKLTTNGNFSVCQQGEAINLESHLNINAKGGGWYSNDAAELLDQHYFTPSKCGSYRFGYTYDKYGCYDQIDLELQVICKPQFLKNLPQQACKNADAIDLPVNYSWLGTGISEDRFIAKNAQRVNFLRARIVEEGCIYDSIYTIQVIEENYLKWSSIPQQLCEGETLNVGLEHPNHSQVEIGACNSFTSTVSNSLAYSPQQCDLENGIIQLGLKTRTDAFCPVLDTTLRIPYYSKPKLIAPEVRTECTPVKWNTSFNNPNTQYTLKSNSLAINGTGNQRHTIHQFGVYDLALRETNEYGCEDSLFVPHYLVVNSTPEASFSIDDNRSTFSLSDRSIGLTNKSTNADASSLKFDWFLNNAKGSYVLSSIRNPYIEFPADTGIFDLTLVATTAFGCADTTAQPVEIVPDIRVFIPNAFTPDLKGPEENATFSIICDNVAKFHISIFNKWGQKVFESVDISNSWDGTNKGEFCQNGVYLYIIDITNKAGKDYTYQGTVNLIR